MNPPFYSYLKVIFNITIPTYYRKIQFKNRKNVTRGPVIIAMNHPNAFMDPIAFSALVSPPMHFLARGDAFNKKTKPFLEGVGIIPIYRFMDFGREGMAKNDETFEAVNKKLAEGNPVIIFPEGICIQERRLRPLKKGLGRMIFSAYEQMKDDEISILPVTMNYQNNPSAFRHDLFINIGERIFIKDFYRAYQENSARAVTQMTLLVQEKMRELLVHIADKENDQMVNELENIYMLEHLESAGKDASDLEVRHNFSRHLATKINERTKKQDPIIPELRSLVLDYSARLKKAGIRDWLLKKENKNASTLPALILKTILFIAGIPIWICGLITNYAPYFLSWKLAKKLTREIEWFAAVSMLIGTFAFQIWYLLIISIVWAFTDWKIMLITMVATVFSGWFSLHFSAFRKKLLGAWRFFSLKRNKNWLREISDKRDQIIQISKSIIQEQ